MGKKTYIIPSMDMHRMEGLRLLDSFTEKTDGIPSISDTDLDANQGTFFEETAPSKGLWDED